MRLASLAMPLGEARPPRLRRQRRSASGAPLGSQSLSVVAALMSAGGLLRRGSGQLKVGLLVLVSFYKILFYFEAFVYESIILSLPPPTCIARTIAMLSHVYRAIHDAPPNPIHLYVVFVCCMPGTISYW